MWKCHKDNVEIIITLYDVTHGHVKKKIYICEEKYSLQNTHIFHVCICKKKKFLNM